MTMTAECAWPVELGALIRERAAAILDLNQRRLSLDWLKEYPLPKLREACGRMAGEIPEDAAGMHVQRELIRNPAFARYLARLLPLLPEEAPLEPPKPVAGRYGQPAPKAAPSCGTGLMSWLDDFIKACQDNNKDPASYELRDVAEVLGIERLDGLGRLIYLENFVPRALDHEQRGRAINSLRQCVGMPAALTREQQDQLMEPYVPASSLFRGTAFSQVWALLERCPACGGFSGSCMSGKSKRGWAWRNIPVSRRPRRNTSGCWLH